LTVEANVDRYHVRSTQAFVLSTGALDLEIALHNLAAWRIPVGIGIHPWFLVDAVRVAAELTWDGAGPMPEGLPRPVRPDEDLRQKRVAAPMDRCFTGLTASVAEIGDLSLSWRGPITQVVVYSGQPDAVCVEPQTMASDGIRLLDEGVQGTGVIGLDPGASVTVGYRLSWPQPR
jgi:galactose mutarotase-like enzyme